MGHGPSLVHKRQLFTIRNSQKVRRDVVLLGFEREGICVQTNQVQANPVFLLIQDYYFFKW